MSSIWYTVAALFTVQSPRRPGAQINSPRAPGESSSHLWSVPGVIRTGSLGTFFACTTATQDAIRVGEKVFGPTGSAGWSRLSPPR